jgi:hypothetical protein
VDEVDRADFAALRTGDHVPIRVVPALPGHERLGAGASIHVSRLVIPLIAFPVLLLVYRHRRKRTRPWFENLVIDTGSGRLSHD